MDKCQQLIVRCHTTASSIVAIQPLLHKSCSVVVQITTSHPIMRFSMPSALLKLAQVSRGSHIPRPVPPPNQNKLLKLYLFSVRLACDHLYGKLLFTWLSMVTSLVVSCFVLSLFPFSQVISWRRSGTELKE